MDKKHHGAFVHLTRPGLSRAQLLEHFRHEYQTYVRDFPVLLARVLGNSPPTSVRRALAENIFEEQTGKLSLGVSHPELFLTMMEGLGISREEVEAPVRTKEALAYRAFLDEVSWKEPWIMGCALLTIFVEGSVHERADMASERVHLPVEEAIARHPMVKHYGCPPEKMLLARAHRAVEGGHRQDAWASILDHVGSPMEADRIGELCERALARWLAYRDGVARTMGVSIVDDPIT